jgi:hypothetical protein
LAARLREGQQHLALRDTELAQAAAEIHRLRSSLAQQPPPLLQRLFGWR